MNGTKYGIEIDDCPPLLDALDFVIVEYFGKVHINRELVYRDEFI